MICGDLRATQLGTVAEQLVRYKLLRFGEEVVAVEHDNPYDLYCISRHLKIQVKATECPSPSRPNTYRFNCKKGSYASKYYEPGEVDVFAFVALDVEQVLFTPFITTQSKRFKVEDFYVGSGYQTWSDIVDNPVKK